jgi:hypothetical protein
MLKGIRRLLELVIVRLQRHPKIVETVELMVHVKTDDVAAVDMKSGRGLLKLLRLLIREADVRACLLSSTTPRHQRCQSGSRTYQSQDHPKQHLFPRWHARHTRFVVHLWCFLRTLGQILPADIR